MRPNAYHGFLLQQVGQAIPAGILPGIIKNTKKVSCIFLQLKSSKIITRKFPF